MRISDWSSDVCSSDLAKIAARAMAGRTLDEQGVTHEVVPPYFSVKEAVFPFVKFPGVDTILGPEMKSTGEVMGGGNSFGAARSEERRVGQEGVSTCRSRWTRDKQKKKKEKG